MADTQDWTGGLVPDASITKSLRPVTRYVTTHNSSGEAVFSSAVPEAAPVEVLPKDAHFSLLYTTSSHPVDMGGDKDVKEYEE